MFYRKNILNYLVGEDIYIYKVVRETIDSLGLNTSDHVCPFCGRRFKSKRLLKIHLVKTHHFEIDELIRKAYINKNNNGS